MADTPKHVAVQHVGGAGLLELARSGSREARDQLLAHSPEEIASGIPELAPSERVELLELSERLDEIVPLLSEAEFTSTLVAVGLADSGWLIEFASSEQRVAAVDLDCWKDFRLSPSRLFEWIDAMIAAGPEVLASAFSELDPELWVLAMKTMADFSLVGMGEDEGGGGGDFVTEDGVVAYSPHSAEHEDRVREILSTALAYAPAQYWQLVFGAISESATECAALAARWHAGRLNDLGFPDHAEAMRAYRPLRAEDQAAVDIGTAEPEPRHGMVASAPLPQQLSGTLVGRALSELPVARANELLGYVLAVANTLAVADELPLAEPESVERSLRKALRGIDRGLHELVRKRNESPARVLDQTVPLDLFRIGVTLAPELGRGKTLADLELEEADADWDEVFEMIEEADRTIAPDGKPH